jgi:hypothetical protein
MKNQLKLRLIFILSLVVLAGVFIAIVSFIPRGQDLDDSSEFQIIEGEDEWILQYDILNNEEQDTSYEVLAVVDGNTFHDSTIVKPGREYTYILHISRKTITDGEVTFKVYQEGKQEPIEQYNYQLTTN